MAVAPQYVGVLGEFQGGLSEGVPLTAFVLVALIENQNNQQVSYWTHTR